MQSKPGTYILILHCHLDINVQIGRWRLLELKPGYYFYIGSAFGPGGIKARVSRHFRRNKHNHWHIDYLREFTKPIGVWYSYESRKQEHRWARVIAKIPDMVSIPGFGCSDCQCKSHLFQSPTVPNFNLFTTLANTTIKSWWLDSSGSCFRAN